MMLSLALRRTAALTVSPRDGKEYDAATKEFNSLLDSLEAAGLHTEVRPSYEKTILIFVHAPEQLLGNTVYKSRCYTSSLCAAEGANASHAAYRCMMQGPGLAVQHYAGSPRWR